MSSNPLFQRLNQIQKGIVERACQMLEDEGKCLIVMTTGTGKTIVGSKIIKEHHDKRVLWLTQTEELITQTYLDLANIFGEQKVGLYKRNTRETEQEIIVASLQTIEKEEYLEAIPKNHFDLIIVDEAHHARADSWQRVIQYFKAKRLGLTATPYRHDGKDLGALFGNSAVHLSYEEAKKMRLIAEETYRVILTNSKVEGVITRSGEYKPNALDRLVISENRNDIIVESYKKYGRAFMREQGLPYKTICFCITVAHAIRMQKLFEKHSIKADLLVGRAGKKSSLLVQQERPQTELERKEVYQNFLRGKGAEVLCVVNVLNEGKNIPDVGCLLLARPTRSGIIFQQQLGRGCRRIEGVKEKYIVLDYVDLIHRKYPPMTLARIQNEKYKVHEIVLDYFRGKDPIVVNEYINYLSNEHSFTPEPKWTKKKIAESLFAWSSAHRFIRTADLVTEKTGLPNRTTIVRHYGSVEACMKDLKIDYRSRREWSKEEVESSLRSYFKKHGKILITDLGPQKNLPSKKLITRYWGGWKECCDKLGLKSFTSKKRIHNNDVEPRRGIWKRGNKFATAVWVQGIRHYIGVFETFAEAVKARDLKRAQLLRSAS